MFKLTPIKPKHKHDSRHAALDPQEMFMHRFSVALWVGFQIGSKYVFTELFFWGLGSAIRHPAPLMGRLEPPQELSREALGRPFDIQLHSWGGLSSPRALPGRLCGSPLGVFCCLVALVSNENVSECTTCKLNHIFVTKNWILIKQNNNMHKNSALRKGWFLQVQRAICTGQAGHL